MTKLPWVKPEVRRIVLLGEGPPLARYYCLLYSLLVATRVEAPQ